MLLIKLTMYLGNLILVNFLKQYKYCFSTEFCLIISREMVVFLRKLWSIFCSVHGVGSRVFSHGYQDGLLFLGSPW